MTPAVFWSARDWAEAIAALPTEGALPTRTVLVPREAVAHSLRRELVKAGHAQVLIGTRFVPTLAAAVAVLEEADLRFETGEEALRSARLLKLFADGLTLEHFPPTLLRERPGWDDAFARTIGDLESVGLRPEDLARDGDARLRDIAAVWSALDAQAGAAWTAPRVWLEAAQALERGAAWPFRGRTLATASAPTSAAEARFLRAVPGVVVPLHGARPVREQRQRPARALQGAQAPGGRRGRRAVMPARDPGDSPTVHASWVQDFQAVPEEIPRKGVQRAGRAAGAPSLSGRPPLRRNSASARLGRRCRP